MDYLEHFGLTEAPFALTPKVAHHYVVPERGNPAEVLENAIERGEGLLKVTGEPGTGKSLLCRVLGQRLHARRTVGYVPAPVGQDATAVLALVCQAFGLPPCPMAAEMTTVLRIFLEDRLARGHGAVLIVDEAQTLGLAGLEAIRLLSTFETDTDKLLRIVLVGQPELNTLLASADLRQLSQRITVAVRTEPFSFSQSLGYIDYRMACCRRPGVDFDPFAPRAKDLIARAAEGVPRLLNTLCGKALMRAADDRALQVTEQQAALTVEEVLEVACPVPVAEDRPEGSVPAWAMIAAALAGVAILGGVGVALYPLLQQAPLIRTAQVDPSGPDRSSDARLSVRAPVIPPSQGLAQIPARTPAHSGATPAAASIDFVPPPAPSLGLGGGGTGPAEPLPLLSVTGTRGGSSLGTGQADDSLARPGPSPSIGSSGPRRPMPQNGASTDDASAGLAALTDRLQAGAVGTGAADPGLPAISLADDGAVPLPPVVVPARPSPSSSVGQTRPSSSRSGDKSSPLSEAEAQQRVANALARLAALHEKEREDEIHASRRAAAEASQAGQRADQVVAAALAEAPRVAAVDLAQPPWPVPSGLALPDRPGGARLPSAGAGGPFALGQTPSRGASRPQPQPSVQSDPVQLDPGPSQASVVVSEPADPGARLAPLPPLPDSRGRQARAALADAQIPLDGLTASQDGRDGDASVSSQAVSAKGMPTEPSRDIAAVASDQQGRQDLSPPLAADAPVLAVAAPERAGSAPSASVERHIAGPTAAQADPSPAPVMAELPPPEIPVIEPVVTSGGASRVEAVSEPVVIEPAQTASFPSSSPRVGASMTLETETAVPFTQPPASVLRRLREGARATQDYSLRSAGAATPEPEAASVGQGDGARTPMRDLVVTEASDPEAERQGGADDADVRPTATPERATPERAISDNASPESVSPTTVSSDGEDRPSEAVHRLTMPVSSGQGTPEEETPSLQTALTPEPIPSAPVLSVPGPSVMPTPPAPTPVTVASVPPVPGVRPPSPPRATSVAVTAAPAVAQTPHPRKPVSEAMGEGSEDTPSNGRAAASAGAAPAGGVTGRAGSSLETPRGAQGRPDARPVAPDQPRPSVRQRPVDTASAPDVSVPDVPAPRRLSAADLNALSLDNALRGRSMRFGPSKGSDEGAKPSASGMEEAGSDTPPPAPAQGPTPDPSPDHVDEPDIPGWPSSASSGPVVSGPGVSGTAVIGASSSDEGATIFEELPAPEIPAMPQF